MSEPTAQHDLGALARAGVTTEEAARGLQTIATAGIAIPRLGQQCPRGHDYAQRSETSAKGQQAMVVFCPSCEPIDDGIAQAAAADEAAGR